jgi:hypothetical protein
VLRKISDEDGGEIYVGESNTNSEVFLKIFKRGKTFFFEKDKIGIVNNTCLVCESVIDFKQGDIEYVCGVFPLGENSQTLEDYIKNNPYNEKEVIINSFNIKSIIN